MIVEGTESVPWVVLDYGSGVIRCLRCGGEHPFQSLFPLSIVDAVRVCQERCKQHSGCVEPKGGAQ